MKPKIRFMFIIIIIFIIFLITLYFPLETENEEKNKYDLLEISLGFAGTRDIMYGDIFKTQIKQESNVSNIRLVSYTRSDDHFPEFIYFLPDNLPDKNVIKEENCHGNCIWIQIKSYDITPYYNPTITINSTLPLYLKNIRIINENEKYIEFSDIYTCSDLQYQALPTSFESKRTLFYTGKILLRLCYGYRIKEEIPRLKYKSDYFNKYGERNLSVFEVPFYYNQTKSANIYVNDVPIHKLNIIFDPVLRTGVCYNG